MIDCTAFNNLPTPMLIALAIAFVASVFVCGLLAGITLSKRPNQRVPPLPPGWREVSYIRPIGKTGFHIVKNLPVDGNFADRLRRKVGRR